MKRGRKPKYATEEERREAMREYQRAYAEARKAGTWKRKSKVRMSEKERAMSVARRREYREKQKLARKAAREAVVVLKRADRIVREQNERNARIAAKEAERAGRKADWELADKELKKRREAAERREKVRLAGLTPEERAEEKRLAAAARERKIQLAREQYGIDLYGTDETPEQILGRMRYNEDQAKAKQALAARRDRKRSKLMQKFRAKRHSAEAAMAFAVEQARAANARDEGRGMRDERRAIEAALPRRLARHLTPTTSTLQSSSSPIPHPSSLTLKEKRELLLKHYGFEVWRNKPVDPNSEAEAEARRRFLRDEEAEYRERNREHITQYNRDYRRRKRAEALLEAQKTWTAKQWSNWQKREQAKQLGRGTPAWLLNEVAKQIAEEEGLTHDQVTQRLIELGCIDFIMKGAEALGPEKAARPAMVKAAVRALDLWLDFDNAILFKPREVKPRGVRAEMAAQAAGEAPAGEGDGRGDTRA